jgi:hypothetical protein
LRRRGLYIFLRVREEIRFLVHDAGRGADEGVYMMSYGWEAGVQAVG